MKEKLKENYQAESVSLFANKFEELKHYHNLINPMEPPLTLKEKDLCEEAFYKVEDFEQGNLSAEEAKLCSNLQKLVLNKYPDMA